MERLFLELDQTLKEAGKYPVIFWFFIFMPLPVLQDCGKPIRWLISDPFFEMLIELLLV